MAKTSKNKLHEAGKDIKSTSKVEEDGINQEAEAEVAEPEVIKNDMAEDKADIDKLLADESEKYLRLAAEYDNFRKRSAKEREMIYSDARVDAIGKLLPVYDNLERALKMDCSDEAFYKGVEMIMTQLTEALSGMGVREIPAVGETFDPNLHNAVMTIENPDFGENIVAEEFQKGFIIGERVIRFSTVVVANSK